jgi:hypothetical protein
MDLLLSDLGILRSFFQGGKRKTWIWTLCFFRFEQQPVMDLRWDHWLYQQKDGAICQRSMFGIMGI